jgi:hypothetical protein
VPEKIIFLILPNVVEDRRVHARELSVRKKISSTIVFFRR